MLCVYYDLLCVFIWFSFFEGSILCFIFELFLMDDFYFYKEIFQNKFREKFKWCVLIFIDGRFLRCLVRNQSGRVPMLDLLWGKQFIWTGANQTTRLYNTIKDRRGTTIWYFVLMTWMNSHQQQAIRGLCPQCMVHLLGQLPGIVSVSTDKNNFITSICKVSRDIKPDAYQIQSISR